MRQAFAYTFTFILLAPAFLTAATPQETLRSTIQKSIQFVEAKGVYWIESKKCVSCHRIGNMIWSLSAAKQKGLQVSDQLDEWIEWSNTDVQRKKENGKIIGHLNKTGVVQIIQTNALAGTEQTSEFTKTILPLILPDQNEDGSWKPGGQLPSQKRDKAETTQVTTMWIALALLQNTPNTEPPKQLTNALEYIRNLPNGKSAEWYVVRSLLERAQGNDDQAESHIAALVAAQKEDGGWGWNLDEASDALATGMALYALSKANSSKDISDSIANGQQFLVSTQRDDGSWKVNGTKSNKRDAPIETSIYWGATWAVLGLSETLP